MESISKSISGITTRLSADNLRAACARGAMTLGIGVFAGRGFRLLRYVILARVLTADKFGLMAIVMAASGLFESFADVGIKQSVIQNKKGAEEQYLNMAWWFQSLRGFGLYVMGLLAAPWISRFYDMPELLPLLRVAFIGMVFHGFVSPRVYVLQKELRFNKVVLLSQSSSLLGTLVTIALAFYLKSVWALVIGFIIEALLRCLLSFVLCPFRPRLNIDKDSLYEILKFARGMFGLPILAFITLQADVIVLGKVVDKTQLGIYSLALILAHTPKVLLARVVGPVLLPAFAKKQDDKASLCNAVLELTRTTATFVIPFVAFLVVCSGPVLTVVYGSKYAQVAVPFSLMCICILLFAQSMPLVGTYLGMGLPHLHRCFAAIRVIILVVLIYPGILLFRLPGAAGVVLLANFIALGMHLLWIKKLINITYREYAYRWLPGLCLAGVVLIPMSLLNFVGVTSSVVSVAAGGLLCLGAWVAGLLFLLNLNRKTKN